MREIKFRIWDGDGYVREGWYIWNKIYAMRNCQSLDPNEEVLEQFTGLCDKNGKEIYEGDIYLSTYRAGGAGSIRGKAKERVKHIVEWDDRGRWRGERIERGRGYGCCHPNCELGEGIEVIGNIHENNELLK